MRAMLRLGTIAAAMFALMGCATLPPQRSADCAVAPAKPVTIDPATQRASMPFDVMIYNVEGLSWPARSGRAASLEAIGAHIAALRAEGKAPDVVMLQEAFSRAAVRMAAALPYATLVPGPGRGDRASVIRGGPREGKRRPTKGEIGLKLAGSGLVILSDHPLAYAASSPFARKSCAGFDCLSNKGVAIARLVVRGLPQPIELVTTHMNAQRASGVSQQRHRAVHLAQTNEIGWFIDQHSDFANPLIFGGDFNMKRDDIRFDRFARRVAMPVVHRYCVEEGAGRCDVRLSWDGDEPWMDTQDLQLFSDGATVKVEPVRVEAWFDGPERGGRLSDHDAFRVTYRLSWPADAKPMMCQ
jgi:endonuclease/exonuclease/phosphatase family metal-dependent hydrolase